MARIVPELHAATMTKAPGAGIYMTPEALEAKSKESDEEQKAKYGASVEMFSFGFSPSVKHSLATCWLKTLRMLGLSLQGNPDTLQSSGGWDASLVYS